MPVRRYCICARCSIIGSSIVIVYGLFYSLEAYNVEANLKLHPLHKNSLPDFFNTWKLLIESFWDILQSSDIWKTFFLRHKMDDKELGLWLSNPSTERVSGAICRHDPSQTLGITKVLFFKAGPVHLLQRVCGCGSREGGKLLRPCSPCTPPCRLPPWEQPFEGVITAACITWVTANGSWSQLMKPLKKPPLLWFLFKFWGVGARPGSQTITDVVMGGLCSRLAFWLVMGRGCSKSTFEERLLVGTLQPYNTAFSIPS